MPKGVEDGEQGKVDTREREECAREPEGASENAKGYSLIRAKAIRENRGGAKDARGNPKGAQEILTHINSFTDVVTGSTSFVIFSSDKRKL